MMLGANMQSPQFVAGVQQPHFQQGFAQVAGCGMNAQQANALHRGSLHQDASVVGAVPVPVRVTVRKLGPPLLPDLEEKEIARRKEAARLEWEANRRATSNQEIVTFPYHDPAFGCHYRLRQHSGDVLDRRLMETDTDQPPPLEALQRWEHIERQRENRHRWWERSYQEMQPPLPFRDQEAKGYDVATACRLPPDEHQGLAWLLA